MSRFNEVCSGYIVFLGDSQVNWKSKKHTNILYHQLKPEYRSLRKVVGEVVWVDRLMIKLTIDSTKLFSVFCDSQAAVHIARNLLF